MKTDSERGYAFVLEGETEKEFYMAFLEYLCKKHSAQIVQNIDETNPDIVYQPETESGCSVIKFKVMGGISNVPDAGDWVESQCVQRYKNCDWYVFLCYDLDDYKPTITKFYEGDWKNLREPLEDSCNVIDVAAAADIEDVMLQDIEGVCAVLDCEIPQGNLPGGKGKSKMKKFFLKHGKIYHEGKRARFLIDRLDMKIIMESNIIPLDTIEEAIFK